MTVTPAYGFDLVAFGPHPDDVELFCGGLLIRLSDLGYRVAVVDLTRGEMATRGTPETRAAEAEAAAAVLGLSHRENLALPDAGLLPNDPDQVAAIVAALRRLRPELVVAPWSRERHPDHEAASALVTRAVFLAGLRRWSPGRPRDPGALDAPPFTPRQVLYYPMRHLAEPTFIVDTTEAAERKLAAIRCYASQVGPAPGAPETLVGSPLSLTSIDARDRFYGAQIGVAHGEPFVSPSPVGLVDPVAHFRANAPAPAGARPLLFPERR